MPAFPGVVLRSHASMDTFLPFFPPETFVEFLRTSCPFAKVGRPFSRKSPPTIQSGLLHYSFAWVLFFIPGPVAHGVLLLLPPLCTPGPL